MSGQTGPSDPTGEIMTTNNPNEPLDTAASFETEPRRWAPALIGAAVAFAIFVVAIAGFALTQGTDEAVAAEVELTTTTLAAFEDTTTTTEAPVTTTTVPAADEADEEPADEPVEEPAEEPAPEEETQPAKLVVDDIVHVGTDGQGTFTMYNVGDEDLTITDVVAPLSISFSDMPVTMEGNTHVDIDVTVDTSGMEVGEYELNFTIDADGAGLESVTVNGEKEFFVVQLIPFNDIDVDDLTVVPHGNPAAQITMWNNEDHDVTVTIESLHARLSLPSEYVLQPGENTVIGLIAPWAVLPGNPMNLKFKVSWWLGSEEASILKIGQ